MPDDVSPETLQSRADLLKLEQELHVYRIELESQVEELRRAQAETRSANERLRMCIEYAPAALVMFDRQLRYVVASRRWISDYGLESQAVVGRAHDEPFPEMSEAFGKACHRSLAGEVIRNDGDRFERRDGTVQWVKWETRPWRTADGDIGGIVVFTENITDRKRAEAEMLELNMELEQKVGLQTRELHENEERLGETERLYRLILEHAADAVYIADQDGRFIYVNQQAVKMLGYSKRELLSMGIADITPQDEAEDEMAMFRRFRSGGPMRWEVHQKRRDGSTIPVELNAVPLPDGSFYGSCRDISERKRAQERIEAYVQQLEAAMEGTLLAVSNMVEQRDPYTAGHERRVGMIAADIAGELGWPGKKCHELQLIGLVHDIGKIGIPAEILSKPSRLTPLEYEVVKAHVTKGYEILRDVTFPLPIAEIIYQHHERMDGSGYPRGLRGEQILPEARVLAVADVVESMASHRPYRSSLGIDAALDEVARNRGRLYAPDAVDALLRLVNDKGYGLPD